MADSEEKETDNSQEKKEAVKKGKQPIEELSREQLLKQSKKYITLLQTAKSKYSDLNARCSSLEEERDGAFAILASLKTRYNVSSIDEFQNKISRVEQLEQQCNILKDNEKALEKKLDDICKHNDSLSRQNLEAKEQVQCMEMQLDTLRMSCKCLQEETVKLNNDKLDLKQQVDNLSSEQATLQVSLKTTNEQLLLTKSLLDTHASDITLLQEQKAASQKKFAEMQDSLNAANEQLQSANSVIDTHFQNITLLQEQKDTCEKKLAETQQTLTVANEQLSSANTMVDTHTSNISILHQQKAASEKKLEDMQNSLEASHKELSSANCLSDKQSNDLLLLQQEKAVCDKMLDEMQEKFERGSILYSEIANAFNNLVESERNLRQIVNTYSKKEKSEQGNYNKIVKEHCIILEDRSKIIAQHLDFLAELYDITNYLHQESLDILAVKDNLCNESEDCQDLQQKESDYMDVNLLNKYNEECDRNEQLQKDIKNAVIRLQKLGSAIIKIKTFWEPAFETIRKSAPLNVEKNSNIQLDVNLPDVTYNNLLYEIDQCEIIIEFLECNSPLWINHFESYQKENQSVCLKIKSFTKTEENENLSLVQAFDCFIAKYPDLVEKTKKSLETITDETYKDISELEKEIMSLSKCLGDTQEENNLAKLKLETMFEDFIENNSATFELRDLVALTENKFEDLRILLGDKTTECDEVRNEIKVLSSQLKKSNDTLAIWKEKIDDIDKQKEELNLQNNVLLEKQKMDLKEIDNLKKQLHEYENDIQKKNFKLQETADKLNDEYCKLMERFENKCSELCDIKSVFPSMHCSLQESIDTVAIWREKEEVLNDQNNVLLEKQKKDLEEIENLKQQLDEYENDIQKHLNLEKDNFKLQETVDELDQEYCKLMERFESKCSELDDINFHISSMNCSLSVELSKVLLETVDIDDEVPQVHSMELMLKQLFDVLAQNLSKIESLKDEIEDGIKAKTCLQAELTQVQDLKQFLEDEVTGLREEVQQSKSRTLSSCDVCSQTYVETMSDYAASAGISEWGVVEDSACINPMEQQLESKIKELQSQLDAKTSLVESIHCQMDLSFGKIEEVSEELKITESDLKCAKSLNSKYKNNIEHRNTMLQKVNNEWKIFKTDINSQMEDIRFFYTNTNKDINETIETIIKNYNECNILMESHKSENVSLKESYKLVSQEIIAILEVLDLNKDKILPDDVNISTHLMKVFDKDHCVSNVELLKNVVNSMVEVLDSKADMKNQVEAGLQSAADSESVCSSCDKLKKEVSELEMRVNKFKTVAVKIKKELNETKQKFDKLTEESKQKDNQMKEVSEETSQCLKNFQNLQAEYDKLEDLCDSLKSANNSFQNDFVATLSELNNHKQMVLNKEDEIKKLLEVKDTIDMEKTELKAKINDLEAKIMVLELQFSDSQSKTETVSSELVKSQTVIKELENHKAQLSKKVEDALIVTKQHSLLDLEMADYERSIASLTEQLDQKNNDFCDLESEMETLTSRIQTLEEEIKFCESHRITEEERAEGFKESLENSKRELNVLRECESSLRKDVASLNIKVETLVLQEEEYKSQISVQSAELVQIKEMYRAANENHQRIVNSLNSKIATQKQDILLANKEVESVKQDFDNYKIRVHSVLKQQKTITPFSPEDAELKEKLEAQNEKFKLKIKELSEKLQANKLESECLQEEHDHLMQRHSKVVEELEAKDSNWNQRLEFAIEEKNKLQTLLENVTSEQSLKNEMLASTYKMQIKIMQDEHKKVMNNLQKQLESADIEISRLQREHQKYNNPSMSSSLLTQDDNYNIFDISTLERQDGEGSECADGKNTPIKPLSLMTIPTTGFMPLEQLLQSPVESHTPTSMASFHDSEKLTTELNSSFKKIDHLSELLNESEANNLRLGEQVRVLKEEFRRQDRNKQREEHAKNLEYMKNVFIKFATLDAGAEKASLIPVLNMILKLSPAELDELKRVSGNTVEDISSASGWGNYLHRWSGLM